MKNLVPALAALALHAAVPGSHAASSDWHDADGAMLRVVTSDRAEADGSVRGALEIRLKPGWKTYWTDPGDAGVPPTLTLADGGGVEMDFPAPQRFDDGYSVWAGYDRPLALALTLRPAQGAGPAQMEAEAFLGLCETICIPVQAHFTIRMAANASEPRDEAIVAQAFAALPGPARPGFEARMTGHDEESIAIDVDLPQGVEIVDLFVASAGKTALGTPQSASEAGFTVPILRGGDALPASLAYTLVTSAGAVSGALEIR